MMFYDICGWGCASWCLICKVLVCVSKGCGIEVLSCGGAGVGPLRKWWDKLMGWLEVFVSVLAGQLFHRGA